MGQTAKSLQSKSKQTSVKQETAKQTNNEQTKKSLPSKKKPLQKESLKSDQEPVKRKEKPEKLTEEQILELEALFIESPESNLAGFPQAMKYTSLAAAWQVDRSPSPANVFGNNFHFSIQSQFQITDIIKGCWCSTGSTKGEMIKLKRKWRRRRRRKRKGRIEQR